MRKMLMLAATVVVTALFAGCNKWDVVDNSIYEARFYTPDSVGRLLLYVDGKYRGILPYAAATPTCGHAGSSDVRPIIVRLSAGAHQLTGRDDKLRSVSISTVTLRKGGQGVSGMMGGTSVSNTDGCLTIGLCR